MHGGPYNMDELTRRRSARKKADAEWDEDREEQPLPKMGWKDVLAMTIAAYQIIFPMLAALFGVLILVYFLFKWWAH